MTTKTEIQSMLFLLEDPDPFVKQEVLNHFYVLGELAVPLLDECRVETKSDTSKQTATDLLFELTFPILVQDFEDLYESGIKTFDHLEKGLFLLTRFGDPTLRTSLYKQKLDAMAKSIANDVLYAIDEVEKMNIVLHYVFQKEAFKGCGDDLFKPEFSYMNLVLDNKKGIPISLAMVVLALAHRLELPFYGINMPLHFIMVYESDTENVYIDPFQEGKFLSKKECEYFLQINGIQPESSYFKKANFSQMLIRMMRNLHYSFDKQGDKLRASKLKSIITMHENYFKE